MSKNTFWEDIITQNLLENKEDELNAFEYETKAIMFCITMTFYLFDKIVQNVIFFNHQTMIDNHMTNEHTHFYELNILFVPQINLDKEEKSKALMLMWSLYTLSSFNMSKTKRFQSDIDFFRFSVKIDENIFYTLFKNTKKIDKLFEPIMNLQTNVHLNIFNFIKNSVGPWDLTSIMIKFNRCSEFNLFINNFYHSSMLCVNLQEEIVISDEDL